MGIEAPWVWNEVSLREGLLITPSFRIPPTSPATRLAGDAAPERPVLAGGDAIEQREKIKRYRNSDYSIRAIAERLGLGRGAVEYALKIPEGDGGDDPGRAERPDS